MAYSPTNWVDNVTPVSAEKLNHIELGIEDAHTEADNAKGFINAISDDNTLADTKIWNRTDLPVEIAFRMNYEGTKYMLKLPTLLVPKVGISPTTDVLYDHGVENYPFTLYETEQVGTIAVKNADHIYLKASSPPDGGTAEASATSVTIDLDNYSEIRVTWECINGDSTWTYSRINPLRVGVALVGDAPTELYIRDAFTMVTTSVDISNLYGDFNIKVSATENNSSYTYVTELRVYKIELVK